MRSSYLSVAVLGLGLVAATALAADPWETPAGYREELRLEVVNAPGGEIRASRDAGQTWLVVAHVLQPVSQLNRQGFRAAAWVEDSCVAATAVNAVHLKIAADPQTGHPLILSLVPHGDLLGAAEANAAIVTDCPPGEGLFGGLGPTVGSPVRLWREDAWQPLTVDYLPQVGDRLLIARLVPLWSPQYLDFENVFGGRIVATYADGGQEEVGRVLTPVTGIGRFEGSRYADCGRIRANHAGVLEISTSPVGMMGAFQIIPYDHANDTEMSYVRTNHQWMVVGPTDLAQGRESTRPPLFWGTLFPSYRPDDLDAPDWVTRLLSRAQVLCRRGAGQEWELLPRIAFSPLAPVGAPQPPDGRLWLLPQPASIYAPLPPVAQNVLMDVTAFRLCLPQALYWPAPEEVTDGG